MKNILMVVTSAAKMTNGTETGLWLSEFAEPYEEFIKQGYMVTIASIQGGKVPIDKSSLEENTSVGQQILALLQDTIDIKQILEKDYDGIFLPGGHGTMFDLPQSKELHSLIAAFYEAGKPVGAVCHGPAGLVPVKLSNGQPLVKGKKITSFTDSEEVAVNLDKVMPFLLESKLREYGANFINESDWSNHVEVDGNLITGQNPQSGIKAALEFIKVLH